MVGKRVGIEPNRANFFATLCNHGIFLQHDLSCGALVLIMREIKHFTDNFDQRTELWAFVGKYKNRAGCRLIFLRQVLRSSFKWLRVLDKKPVSSFTSDDALNANDRAGQR